MYFLTNSHCIHRVKMKRGKSGGTYYSAQVRRSHSVVTVNKLCTVKMGFDLSYNMEAAAHKIGVNLIRKRGHDWFSKEMTPVTPVGGRSGSKCGRFNRTDMIISSQKEKITDPHRAAKLFHHFVSTVTV